MVIVMQIGVQRKQIEAVIDRVRELGYTPHPIYGTELTVIAAIGDERGKAQLQVLESMPGVDKVVPILQPFKLSGREFKPETTIIKVEGVEIGGEEIIIMAGPCSVESKEQIL